MYKPANAREFITPAVHKKAVETFVNGRLVKGLEMVGTLRGKFKQKGTSEIGANGLTLINDKITFVTWYNSNLQASDVLEINGINYEIIGTVENVEMRGRYAVINLERIGGGA
jgi:hypothetical protein